MSNTLIPSQLFIGNGIDVIQEVEQHLQSVFCNLKTQDGSCFCTSCRHIKNRQHQKVLWFKPERDYKVQDVEIVFERIAFTLDHDDHYYFVFEQAETFNVATANRLLKVLEEPPAGYHFLLITGNENALLETIRSRCHVVRTQSADEEHALHPLLSFFIFSHKREDPLAFEQLLKQLHFSDSQSVQLAHQLMNNFSQKVIEEHLNAEHLNAPDIQSNNALFLSLIQKALLKPPQSGSSEIFWKNLYLQFDLCL